jgi:hypothetical protein
VRPFPNQFIKPHLSAVQQPVRLFIPDRTAEDLDHTGDAEAPIANQARRVPGVFDAQIQLNIKRPVRRKIRSVQRKIVEAPRLGLSSLQV